MLKAVLRSGRLPNAVSAGVLSFLGPLRMRNLNVANDKLMWVADKVVEERTERKSRSATI